MKDRKFDFNIQVITSSKQLDVFKKCNAISFTNIGDTQVKIDEAILNPSATPATVLGDSITISGHVDEIFVRDSIQIIFVQPLGAAPQLQVIQKFYIE